MPVIEAPNKVMLKVICAGVCKTDIWVSKGVITGDSSYPFGHEFCGEVVDKGTHATRFKLGQRVAVNPIIPCFQCDDCDFGNQHLCANTTMLGVDHAGAFAKYVCVPENQCYPLANELPPELIAYAEPIAAALSINQIDFTDVGKVGLAGNDRISQLSQFVLKTLGVSIIEPTEMCPVDVLIVTSTDQCHLNNVKAGGTIILKCRSPYPWHLNSTDIVRKRLRIVALSYAPFDEAIVFLQAHAKALKQFIGQSYSLSEFDQAFSNDTHKKIFLLPCAD
jgi:threonine dehydrogenase-like Zn-dependent dehydrogenase